MYRPLINPPPVGSIIGALQGGLTVHFGLHLPRRTLVLGAVAVVASIAASGAFAAGEFEYEPQFAAPTYGVALMPLDIGLSRGQDQFTLLLPAADVRVAAGSKVTDRGGFWHGYEAGGMFFFQPTAVGFEVPEIGNVGGVAFTDTYSGNDGTAYSAT